MDACATMQKIAWGNGGVMCMAHRLAFLGVIAHNVVRPSHSKKDRKQPHIRRFIPSSPLVSTSPLVSSSSTEASEAGEESESSRVADPQIVDRFVQFETISSDHPEDHAKAWWQRGQRKRKRSQNLDDYNTRTLAQRGKVRDDDDMAAQEMIGNTLDVVGSSDAAVGSSDDAVEILGDHGMLISPTHLDRSQEKAHAFFMRFAREVVAYFRPQ